MARSGLNATWRALALLTPVVAGLGSCVNRSEIEADPSVIAQLLVSTSADRAVQQMNFEIAACKSVYVNTEYFQSESSRHALGAIIERLNAYGARLTRFFDDADLIAVPRSGASQIHEISPRVGTPVVPLPFTSGSFPEINLADKHGYVGISVFTVHLYDAKSGAFVYTTGPRSGGAFFDYWQVFGFPYENSDIPELTAASGEQHPGALGAIAPATCATVDATAVPPVDAGTPEVSTSGETAPSSPSLDDTELPDPDPLFR